ncbi:MAG: hypothetical protein GEU26_15475 [Nitrososphaeraceae archaeon]|nr:hypothetical protein [Nitrososphaeraceae archaeon]
MGTNDGVYIITDKHNTIHCSCNTEADVQPFFIRPKLSIDSNVLTPQVQRIPTNITRQYVRVRVRNIGKGLASGCRARLRLTKWNENSLHIDPTDIKNLVWAGGSPEVEIYPNDDVGEVLDVIFSDSDFGTGDKIRAMVSTQQAESNPDISAQDGFGTGEFEVELKVLSKHGSCKSKFFIEVGRNFENLTMHKQRTWFEVMKDRIRNMKYSS